MILDNIHVHYKNEVVNDTQLVLVYTYFNMIIISNNFYHENDQTSLMAENGHNTMKTFFF